MHDGKKALGAIATQIVLRLRRAFPSRSALSFATNDQEQRQKKKQRLGGLGKKCLLG